MLDGGMPKRETGVREAFPPILLAPSAVPSPRPGVRRSEDWCNPFWASREVNPEALRLGLAVPRSDPLLCVPSCCIAFGTFCVASRLALDSALPIGISLEFSKTFPSWVSTGCRVGTRVGRGSSVSTDGCVGACVGRGSSVSTGGCVGACVERGRSVGIGGRVGTRVGRGGSVGFGGRVGCGGSVGIGGRVGCGGSVGIGGRVGCGGSVGIGGRVGTRVGRGGSIGTQMTVGG
jgi:hypothetical protein